MSNWNQVTKYLDITPTERDTTVNTKPLSITKGRAIRKVFSKFVLEAFSESTFLHGNARLCWQYNVTMPTTFRIRNWGELRTNLLAFNFGSVAIRYRVGTAVTRYILAQRATNPPLFDMFYSGQEIKPNFVVEIWKINLSVGGLVGLHSDFTFVTNLATLPSSPDDDGSVTEAVELVEDDLFHAYPEPIPTPYGEESAWLDNP